MAHFFVPIGRRFCGRTLEALSAFPLATSGPSRCGRVLIFQSREVEKQLQSLSVLEAISLRKKGYAYRTTFREFVSENEYFPLLLCAGQATIGSDPENKQGTDEECREAALKIVTWLRQTIRDDNAERLRIRLALREKELGRSLEAEERAEIEQLASEEEGADAEKECHVGRTMVFFTRQAQRLLIKQKRKALEMIRPAALVIQSGLRNQKVIDGFDRKMQLIVSFQAQARRYAVQKKMQRLRQLRAMFNFATALNKAQQRFRRHKRAAIKIQRRTRAFLTRVRWARDKICGGVLMIRAKRELRRRKAYALIARQIHAKEVIVGQHRVNKARAVLYEQIKIGATLDLQRYWRGYLARAEAALLRAERIVTAAVFIQGYFKTLYCRTLLAQYQSSKAYEKAGRAILAVRTMSKTMDYTGRHHLKYLNPGELPTHKYSMPALTAQGKANPKLGTRKDTRKYVCVSVTPIPWYRYPSTELGKVGEGKRQTLQQVHLLAPGAPEETGLKRGDWVTAALVNDKWLCTDCGRWLPLYVNGVRVLEPGDRCVVKVGSGEANVHEASGGAEQLHGVNKRDHLDRVIVPPPRNAGMTERRRARGRTASPENNHADSCAVKHQEFRVTKTFTGPAPGANAAAVLDGPELARRRLREKRRAAAAADRSLQAAQAQTANVKAGISAPGSLLQTPTKKEAIKRQIKKMRAQSAGTTPTRPGKKAGKKVTMQGVAGESDSDSENDRCPASGSTRSCTRSPLDPANEAELEERYGPVFSQKIKLECTKNAIEREVRSLSPQKIPGQVAVQGAMQGINLSGMRSPSPGPMRCKKTGKLLVEKPVCAGLWPHPVVTNPAAQMKRRVAREQEQLKGETDTNAQAARLQKNRAFKNTTRNTIQFEAKAAAATAEERLRAKHRAREAGFLKAETAATAAKRNHKFVPKPRVAGPGAALPPTGAPARGRRGPSPTKAGAAKSQAPTIKFGGRPRQSDVQTHVVKRPQVPKRLNTKMVLGKQELSAFHGRIGAAAAETPQEPPTPIEQTSPVKEVGARASRNSLQRAQHRAEEYEIGTPVGEGPTRSSAHQLMAELRDGATDSSQYDEEQLRRSRGTTVGAGRATTQVSGKISEISMRSVGDAEHSAAAAVGRGSGSSVARSSQESRQSRSSMGATRGSPSQATQGSNSMRSSQGVGAGAMRPSRGLNSHLSTKMPARNSAKTSTASVSVTHEQVMRQSRRSTTEIELAEGDDAAGAETDARASPCSRRDATEDEGGYGDQTEEDEDNVDDHERQLAQIQAEEAALEAEQAALEAEMEAAELDEHMEDEELDADGFPVTPTGVHSAAVDVAEAEAEGRADASIALSVSVPSPLAPSSQDEEFSEESARGGESQSQAGSENVAEAEAMELEGSDDATVHEDEDAVDECDGSIPEEEAGDDSALLSEDAKQEAWALQRGETRQLVGSDGEMEIDVEREM